MDALMAAADNPGLPVPGRLSNGVAEASNPSKDASWQVEPQATVPADSLLQALQYLTKVFGKPYTAEALTAGLPLVDNQLTPRLFIRAAEKAHLKAKLVRRPLSQLSSLVLPCVLLLQKKQSCILIAYKDKNTAVVIVPETSGGKEEIKLKDLNRQYTGYSLLVKPEYVFESRTDSDYLAHKSHWFWSAIALTYPIYTEVVLATFLINCFALFSPLFAMNVYDRVVPNDALDTLWVLAIGVGVLYFFDFIIRVLRSQFIDAANRKTDVLLSARIFAKIQNIKMAARPDSAGVFANNMQQFEAYRNFLSSFTVATFIDLPFAILFLIAISYIGNEIVLIPVVAVPILILSGFWAQEAVDTDVKDLYRFSSQKQALLYETLMGIETIKATQSEGMFQRRFESLVGAAAETGIKVRMVSNWVTNFSGFVQQITSVIVIIVGVYEISDHRMTMGALIACTILTSRALIPLSSLAGLLTQYRQSVASIRSLDQVMQMPEDSSIEKNPLHKDRFAGKIELREVSLKYSAEQTAPALNKVSCLIHPGEKVGIIGRIGSGKSSFEKLLMGLYAPTSGTILMDGLEINQLDFPTLRRNIGYVPQDIQLFYGSVRDNITLAAPYIDETAILRASEIAGVLDFIGKETHGFNLQVGERGEKLSGGQRQSIAIARSLLLDPPILILDEPTNAMDSKSEMLFKERLKWTLQNKTVILITHKGTLLDLVDRVLVMDGGVLVADGPRDAVLKALAEGKIHSPQKGL